MGSFHNVSIHIQGGRSPAVTIPNSWERNVKLRFSVPAVLQRKNIYIKLPFINAKDVPKLRSMAIFHFRRVPAGRELVEVSCRVS